MLKLKTAAAAAAMLLSVAGPAAAKSGHLDDNLYTDYSMGPEFVSLISCGQLVNAHGCFGGSDISPPFEQACAVVEDPPVYKKNKVMRTIYILDSRNSSKDPMLLYIYARTDTITANDDTVDVEYQQRIFLGNTGGFGSKCRMVNSPNFVYVGTNKSKTAIQFNKSNQTMVNIGKAGGVVSITADNRGYVAVTSGDGGEVDEYAPDGTAVAEGYQETDFVGTTNAWVPQQ